MRERGSGSVLTLKLTISDVIISYHVSSVFDKMFKCQTVTVVTTVFTNIKTDLHQSKMNRIYIHSVYLHANARVQV